MKALAAAILVPSLLVAGAAAGQDVPEPAFRDLWCGTAFGLVLAESPADVDEAGRVLLEGIEAAGPLLIERARSVYLELGYTSEAFDERRAALAAEIAAEFERGAPAYYYDTDCGPLIGGLQAAP